jgi:hypothetical protein
MDHIQPTGVASCLVLFLILFPILCTILWRIAYPPLFFFFFGIQTHNNISIIYQTEMV